MSKFFILYFPNSYKMNLTFTYDNAFIYWKFFLFVYFYIKFPDYHSILSKYFVVCDGFGIYNSSKKLEVIN